MFAAASCTFSGMASELAATFAVPAGTYATGTCRLALTMPLTTSPSVPSPPTATTKLKLCSAAAAAHFVASPLARVVRCTASSPAAPRYSATESAICGESRPALGLSMTSTRFISALNGARDEVWMTKK
jgi:hypothetical protein